nr:hypothetical protein [Tanacetum cinerariifolium]
MEDPSQPSEGPSQPVEEDSLVEEVAPVKWTHVRRRQSAKKNDKDVSEPWTPQEEVALCRAWVDVPENSKEGNAKKSAAATDPSIVDALLSKFIKVGTSYFCQGMGPPLSPSQPVEEDSLVEEVAPVKWTHVRRRQSAKKNDKDVSEPWTPQEEVALCRAWVDVPENSKEGNAKKSAGFGRK